ncbi:MAG: PEP-CTERM sorting domain-containing protein [Gallionella sp.]|nr:MAG: PEP-CTERM sorting domain-containing protein [Gallionella sp.]
MNVQACFSLRSLIGWTSAAFLALATSTASAAVLYDQTPQDGGLGFYANPNWPQQMADNFTLGGAANLEGITWWGGYGSNFDAGDDDFLVRLYSNVTGTGAVLQEFGSVPFIRTPTVLFDSAGNAVYQYDFALTAPLGMSPGAYYLFVQNLGTSDWFWQEASSGNGDLWFRGEDTDTWAMAAGAGDLASRLDGTPVVVHVPEPSPLALLGIAGLSLALLAGRRRRQRQPV